MAEIKNIGQKTDEELIVLVLKNQDYFSHIIKRYEDKLFRYISRISNFRKEDIEDILQDVFIKVYQNLNDFDHGLKFSSWIYRIAHNQVISVFRKNKSRGINNTYGLNDETANNIASDLNLEKEIDKKILAKNINKILNNLDIKYRDVLALKYLEEKSYQEISYILQKPMGTVAVLINRAKNKFKEEFNNKNI
ncbi:MAG: RNA polymerase sigma factor [Candidatus Falkowbacteria bacterium]